MPPYDLDVVDRDYRRDIYYHRPSTTIRVETTDGELIQQIDLPELNLTRDEVDPTWLAMVEAEEAQK